MIYDGDGTSTSFVKVEAENSDPIRTIELELEDKSRFILDDGVQNHIIDVDGGCGSSLIGKRRDKHILTANLDGIYKSIYLKFGQEPIIINTDVDLRLSYIHFDGSKVLLFYNKGNSKEFKAILYDIATTETQEIIDVESSYYFSGPIRTLESEKLYLVRYRSKEVNLESFILDIENKTLEVLANLARGNAAILPQHFTVTDD